MGSIKRICNLNYNLQDLSTVERLSGDEVFKGMPFQSLHHNKRVPIRFINFMNSADVGMVQGRRSTCLALKSLQCLVIARQLWWKKLQSYISAQAEILGAVDHSHATASQSLLNAVMGNDGAYHLRPSVAMLGCPFRASQRPEGTGDKALETARC